MLETSRYGKRKNPQESWVFRDALLKQDNYEHFSFQQV
jgi:hypothetical protein